MNVTYEVRPDGVFMVCEIPDYPGAVAEMRVPDELVAAWLAEPVDHCPDCGARLSHVGEDAWCEECT